MNRSGQHRISPGLWAGVFVALSGLVQVTGAGRAADIALAADPVADLNAQYETVLQVLKKPGASGILVTEVTPESPAAAAGLRAGDIVTFYYGAKVTKLAELRVQVADAIAKRLEDKTTENVLLRGWRAAAGGGEWEPIVMQLPRVPLGIRAVEVEAGVAGPRNPPANLRGTVALDWKQVLETLRADGGVLTLRAEEAAAAATGPVAATGPGVGRAADLVTGGGGEGGTWLGWQRYGVKADGEDGLTATLEIFRVEPAAGPGTEPAARGPVAEAERMTFTFRLRMGDYATTPAFVLEAVGANYPGDGDGLMDAKGTRVGDELMTEITKTLDHGGAMDHPAVEKHSYAVPLTALTQAAAPWVAAAMPQKAGAVLGVQLLSVRDFLPRPGYVLATRGWQPMPAMGGAPAPATTKASATQAATTPAETAWRVDLLHCGVIIESYWFSDQRRLLCVEAAGYPSVVSRRVGEAGAAMAPVEAGRGGGK